MTKSKEIEYESKKKANQTTQAMTFVYGGSNANIRDASIVVGVIDSIMTNKAIFNGTFEFERILIDESDAVPLAEVVAELEPVLRRGGYLDRPVNNQLTREFHQALVKMTSPENLEERWRGQDNIERKVVAYLKTRGA